MTPALVATAAIVSAGATSPYADLFMMRKQLRTLKQLAEEVGVGRS